MRSEPAASARSATLEDGARHAARYRGHADGVESVLQPLYPDVIDGPGDRLRRGTVDQGALQVLLFENFPEFLYSPVLDQQFEPRLGPQSAVAVVAEHADHALPDIGHLVERH